MMRQGSNAKFGRRAGMLVGAAMIMVALTPAAGAAQTQAQPIPLQIPAQSLSSALNTLAMRSMRQLVVDASLTRGISSKGLTGTYTVNQALERLLRGTGLTYRVVGETMFVERAPRTALLHPISAEQSSDQGVPGGGAAVAAPAEATEEAPPSDIVVTGSRLARTGYSQPTPVAVLTSEALQASGFSNISDVLNRTPEVGVGLGQANSYYNGDAGAAFINLRGLGTNRTLVLVNGRRRVSGTELSSAVDLTTIPANLIDRIEVITGGAAAVYGADAVTGVVNVTLKQKVDALELNARSGISSRGDAATNTLGLLFGKPFADDRGSFVVGASYNTEAPLQANKRSFGRRQVDLFGNPANTGPADNIFDSIAVADYRYPGTSYGGAFVIGNTRYTYDGGVRPTRNDATPYGPLGFLGVGGDGFNDADFAPLRNRTRVFSSLAHLDYEITDGIKFFGDVQYARTKTVAPLQPSFDLGITIPITNPLIPNDVRALLVQAGQTSLSIGRTNIDQGISKRYITRNTYTAVGGLEGDIGDRFQWTAFYQYGRYKADITRTHDRIISRFNDAVNVIAGPGGTPICASATAVAAGCQPLNLFGPNAATPAALAYFDYTVRRSVINTQEVAGAQITGKPFDLPAGPVQIAAGVEYRREALRVNPDPRAVAGTLLNSVDGAVDADFNVKEAFGELLIPILSDQPFAKELSIEGAVRYSDYNTIGGTFAWKLGGQWAPVDDLRFRVTRSKSVRAPNLSELNNPGSSSNSFILDPCDSTRSNLTPNRRANCTALGIGAAYTDPFAGVAKTVITGGNPGLDEETSNSWTAGAVLTPRAIPGLAISGDWFQIKIAGAINVVPLQRLVDNCVDAASISNPFCPLITRRADGAITGVNVTPINIGQLRAEGVDVQGSYSSRLGGSDNRVRLTVAGTYLAKNEVLVVRGDPSTLDRNAGEVDNPKWRFNVAPGFTAGPVSFDWTLRYISRSKVDVQATAEGRDDNRVGSKIYNDIYANFVVDERFSLYAGINNLFDVEPPFSAITYQGTGRGALYDNIGRYFFVGANARF